MKKIFLMPLAALLLFAVGCNDDNIGNPNEVIAGTGEITNVLMRTADVKAEVYGAGITERGVVYATVNKPTLGDSYVMDTNAGAGIFTLTLEGLTPETTYYVRSFANYGDETVYGTSRSFRTKKDLIPEVKANFIESTQIEFKTMIEGGDDAWVISERGIAYNLTGEPTIDDNKVSVPVKENTNGRGEFVANVTGLAVNTAYKIRPYCVTEATGVIYGEEVRLTTLASQSAGVFKDALEAAGLRYGIVYNDKDEFVMHYSYDIDVNDIDNCYVTITYIEPTGDKDAKHVKEKVTFNLDFTEVTWANVSNDNNDFSGMTRFGTKFSVEGTTSLTIDKPMPQNEILALFTSKAYSGIGRISELHKGNHHGSISSSFFDGLDPLEVKAEENGILARYPSIGGYVGRTNEFRDGKPYMPQIEDVITFSPGEYGGGWMEQDSAKREATWTALEPFRNIWFDVDGLIIVREVKEGNPVFGDHAGAGAFYYYAISAKNETWVKMWLRQWGK